MTCFFLIFLIFSNSFGLRLCIDIIDIGVLLEMNGSRADRNKIIRQVADACKTEGFFYIRNHGIEARWNAHNNFTENLVHIVLRNEI